MLSSKAEQSPLLHRGRQSNRSRRVEEEKKDDYDQDEWKHLSMDEKSSLDKRKVLLSAKIGAAVTKQWQKVTFPILPPTDTDSVYEDVYNDEAWSCTFGTHEDDGIWMNHTDQVGTLMSFIVWILFFYCALTMILLAQHAHLPIFVAAVHCTLCALALTTHAKCSFTDPGSIPASAVPLVSSSASFHAMCSHCQVYKPDGAHHCRICDRCISGMDHHCPWMNNCIGKANMKQFLLFLIYTWTSSVFSLIIFGINYFGCSKQDCMFSGVEIHLVRCMTWLCLGALAFTTSMLLNVVYAVVTGVGTIDRLKRKAKNTWESCEEEPIPLVEIFGIGPKWTWCLPTDPLFADYDYTMGYSTRQRLLRTSSKSEASTTKSWGYDEYDV